MVLSFLEQELWVIEVYIVGKRIFDLFCTCDLDLMTFTYELDRYCCRYSVCANNELQQGFRKLSDRYTDKQTCYACHFLSRNHIAQSKTSCYVQT